MKFITAQGQKCFFFKCPAVSSLVLNFPCVKVFSTFVKVSEKGSFFMDYPVCISLSLKENFCTSNVIFPLLVFHLTDLFNISPNCRYEITKGFRQRNTVSSIVDVAAFKKHVDIIIQNKKTNI